MQNSKLRILLWAPFGAGTHYWGPGTNAFRLYQRAILNGDISVDLAHGSAYQDNFPEVYRKQYLVEEISNNSKLSLFRFFLKSNKFFDNHIDEFDVFHGIGGFHSTFNAAIRATERGIPSFIKMTGLHGGFGNSSFFSKVLGLEKYRKKNANKIAGFIAISNAIRDNLLAHGIEQERIHLIPNGVDTNVFYPVSKERKEEIREQLNIPNRITFVYVGGLTQNKRQHICVEAVLELIKKGFDIQLMLVGPDRNNGIELSNIHSIIKRYPNLKDRIILIEYTDHPSLYYQASDYFLLISGYEGMPNSLLEAMAVGLPSFVTEIPGIIDLIQDGKSGIFVKPEVADICDKLENTLINSDRINSLSKNALDVIENNFSATKIWNKHLDLFNRHVK